LDCTVELTNSGKTGNGVGGPGHLTIDETQNGYTSNDPFGFTFEETSSGADPTGGGGGRCDIDNAVSGTGEVLKNDIDKRGSSAPCFA